jgi:hypothetical protein
MAEHVTETVYQIQVVDSNSCSNRCGYDDVEGLSQSVHSRVLIEPGTDRASPKIWWSYSLSKDLVTPS